MQLGELSAIEDIIMIGYPDGIWDSINNQPIIRRGITATQPKNNFNGKQEFLIDAACSPRFKWFPGYDYFGQGAMLIERKRMIDDA